MVRDWLEDNFEVIVIVVICLILVAVGIQAMRFEDLNWQKYAASHHCEARGTKKGEVEPVFGGKGGFTMGEDQTIYVCDGGEIVIR